MPLWTQEISGVSIFRRSKTFVEKPLWSNDYLFGIESRIDLKPGCILNFVRCLEVYKGNFINMDSVGPFFIKKKCFETFRGF